MNATPPQTDEPDFKGHLGTDLTVGSIPRHLISFSIPMLAGSALQTAYSIVNAVWVGRGLGTECIAAVSISFPIFFLLVAIAGGLTMAATILVSQRYGAKDFDGMHRVIQNSIVLTMAVSFICVIIGHYTAGVLLSHMDTPPTVLPLATKYLQLLVWSIPCTFGMFLIASVLRGVGDSKTPLYFQAISLLLTAGLDPLLMFGWLGFPKLGLNGTAWATIFSQFAALIALVVFLERKKHIAAPKWKGIHADWPTSMLTLRIGIPSMVQQALVSIGIVFVVSLVNQFGESAAAAYGSATRLDMLAFMPAMTLGMAVSTLAGQNIGAKRFDRVHLTFIWGMIFTISITAVASALVIAFPKVLMSMFITDPHVLALGSHYLRVVGIGYCFFAVMFVSSGVINGAGHTMATTIFSLISLWVVRVPLSWYLAHRLHSIHGIWLGIVISYGIGMCVSLGYYYSGRWKIPIKRPEVEPEPLVVLD